MRLTPYSPDDFDHSPFIVFYEMTRACDLACAHCRACARPQRHPHELPTEQSRALIDDLRRFDKANAADANTARSAAAAARGLLPCPAMPWPASRIVCINPTINRCQ